MSTTPKWHLSFFVFFYLFFHAAYSKYSGTSKWLTIFIAHIFKRYIFTIFFGFHRVDRGCLFGDTAAEQVTKPSERQGQFVFFAVFFCFSESVTGECVQQQGKKQIENLKREKIIPAQLTKFSSLWKNRGYSCTTDKTLGKSRGGGLLIYWWHSFCWKIIMCGPLQWWYLECHMSHCMTKPTKWQNDGCTSFCLFCHAQAHDRLNTH